MISAKYQSDDDLRNCRIGYQNLLTSASLIDAEVALAPDTYNRYRPIAGVVQIRYRFSQNERVDFVGIAAHNLGTHQNGGVPVLISYSTSVGGALTEIEAVQNQDNSAIMILFDEIEAAEIAILTDAPIGLEMGVISSGKTMQMQRMIYGGHSPAALSQKTKYQSTVSESGQFLGRRVIRRGAGSMFEFNNLSPDWYRQVFQPFVQSAVETPFFIMWRPDSYGREVAYGFTKSDIRPQNQGGSTDLMSVSFNVQAHSDV